MFQWIEKEEMKIMQNPFGLSVYTKISFRTSLILSLLLFFVLIAGYFTLSYARHVENPDDKIVPSISQLSNGVQRAVLEQKYVDEISILSQRLEVSWSDLLKSKGLGEVFTNLKVFFSDLGRFLKAWVWGILDSTFTLKSPIAGDTFASLKRFFLGVIIGSFIGVTLGLLMGLFPFFEALFLRFVLYFGKIPPLAIMPIIFVFAGIGEELKVILIAVGILFPIALDTYLNVSPKSKKGIPSQQLVKALSLGIRTPSVFGSIVLPQIMPSILNAIRMNLLNAWLFLIASEAIAAEAGLGYRIFLVRRYLAMDTIIPYVFWIAMLSFLFDAALIFLIRRGYPWFQEAEK